MSEIPILTGCALRNIYIFIVDCLRFDHVHYKHDGKSITPNIDDFASDSVVFTNAISQATWSRNAGAALLTGLYPAATGLVPSLIPQKDNATEYKTAAVSSNVPQTLASVFQDRDFSTFAYSANPFFSRRYNLVQGFDTIPSMYRDPILSKRLADGQALAKRLDRKPLPIITLRDLLAAVYRDEKESDQLTIVWAMDMHPPLYDRARSDETHDIPNNEIFTTVVAGKDDIAEVKAVYRNCISYFDRQFGSFLNRLKQKGTYDDAVIVLTSDHGESFGEHGLYGHTGFPYEPQIHIPLLFKFPSNQFCGQKSDELVGHIDIFPTLADVFALQLKAPVHGKSLVPLLEGTDTGHTSLIIHDQTRNDHWEYLAVRTKNKKYISRKPLNVQRPSNPMELLKLEWNLFKRFLKNKSIHKKRRMLRKMIDPFYALLPRQTIIEVYDLSTDPNELNDISKSSKGGDVLRFAQHSQAEYLSTIKNYLQENSITYTEADVDERTLLRLQDLGYIE